MLMATNRQLLRQACLALSLSLFCPVPSTAQATFTQQLQQQRKGEGKVTIAQDEQITTLVDGPQTPPKDERQTEKKGSDKESKPSQTQQQEQARQAETPADTVAAMPRMHTGRPRKATGYRIQVFAGSNTRRDRQRAEHIKTQLKNLFPEEAVYVHFYSPRWICRIGNYRTYDEALQMKKEIKQMGFESATIVKGQITVYD